MTVHRFYFTNILKLLAISSVVFVIFLCSVIPAQAVTGINRQINFQGKIVNPSTGVNSVLSGTTVVFTIYDHPTSGQGTALWTESQSVTTTDGIFRVALGSVTAIPASLNTNWSGLYLGIKVGADSEMSPRVQLSAVPFAFNSQQVAGLTVVDSATAASSTSATLKIGTSANNPITVDLGLNNVTFNTGSYSNGQTLTFTSTGTTSITLPSSGTLLTNTSAAVQTVTSTQTTGTVLGIADSTGLTGAITGFNIALTSSTNSQDKKGIAFDLSGGTGGNYYDLYGSGGTWAITREGAIAFSSAYGNAGDCLKSGGGATSIMTFGACGGGGTNYWNLVSGNGVSNGGYISPINSTADFLIGSQATSSAKFAVLGVNTGQTTASVSGNFIVMPQNGWGGMLGIGTNAPVSPLTIYNTSLSNAMTITQNNSAGTAVNGLLINMNNSGGTVTNGINITRTSGTITNGLVMSFISSSGTGISIAQSPSTGTGISLGSAGSISNGNGIVITGNISGNSPGFSGSYIKIDAAKNITLGASPQNETGSYINLVRANSVSLASTFNMSGDMLNISSNCTVSNNGVCTDSSHLISLTQSLASASGSVLFINNGGSGYAAEISSASNGKAAVVIAQAGLGDIFTASASGTPIFTITRSGGIALGTNGLSVGTNSQCLIGGTTAAWGSCGGVGGTNYWNLVSGNGVSNGGYVTLINSTADLLIGGQSTASAKFAVLNLNNNWTQATLSGRLNIADDLRRLSPGPIATISGNTGSVILSINNNGFGDLLTASNSGNTKFVINRDGYISLAGSQINTSNYITTPNFTVSTAGVVDGLTGLTLASGAITLGGSTGSGLCLNGGTSASWGSCGTGGPGGPSYIDQKNGLTHIGNVTTDFAIGGTSTASAKYVFGVGANGADPIATFSGTLMMEAQANSSAYDQTNWNQISGTVGTIGGGTASVASISAMISYNGSLYVGTTNIANGAEVYRYNSGTSWTRVSNATAGSIDGTTTGIASVSAMTVFDGYLYIGTSKMNAAEVYRYNGGSSWTKVSGPTAGTFGTLTLIDGVASLAVYQGTLYAGLRELSRASLIVWGGGLTWTVLNNTAGTFVATNTITQNSIDRMVVKNGALYLATRKDGDSDVLRYAGGNSSTSSYYVSMNLASATGSYLVNNVAVTPVNEITAMTVFNGAVVVAVRRGAGQADVISLNDGMPTGGGATSPNSWTRLNAATGQMAAGSGETTGIDSITALAVYKGVLYAGTNDSQSAEIYKYVGGDKRWIKVSQSSAGQIATGGTVGIYGVANMIPINDDLYAGTYNGVKAEVYKLSNINVNKSYSIEFHAAPSVAGGEQGGNDNLASIFFLASASANLGNSAGNTGAFIFSHGIQTRNGSYDVAEDYPTRDDTLQPGDVVAIDKNEKGFVKKTGGAYDYSVLGVFSESPALRLSQEDAAINGGRAIPVALAGRVPVKVSTESGEIKSGDYLTPSSVPGVAMKALKSSVVFAQAMEGYSGDGVGKVLSYIKSMTYQGSIADNFATLDTNSSNFATNVLDQLRNQGQTDGKSSIITDRLIAGLEIITPTIRADTIYAKTIKADRIEGLSIYTDKISSLSDSIDLLQSLMSSKSAVLGTSTSSSQLTNFSSNDISLANLSVSGLATVSADLNIKGNSLIEGMLTVFKSITSQNLIVGDFASFFGDVFFKKNVTFEGRTVFNNDTAGFAIVKKGTDKVEVVFEDEYQNPPVVTASIVLDKNEDPLVQKQLEDIALSGNVSYVITNRTAKGFTIKLSKATDIDVGFSWIALSIKNIKTTTSSLINNNDPSPATTGSAAFQSIIKQLDN